MSVNSSYIVLQSVNFVIRNTFFESENAKIDSALKFYKVGSSSVIDLKTPLLHAPFINLIPTYDAA